MTLGFDDLTLVETNVLTEVLINLRAGRSFYWPGVEGNGRAENEPVAASLNGHALQEKRIRA